MYFLPIHATCRSARTSQEPTKRTSRSNVGSATVGWMARAREEFAHNEACIFVFSSFHKNTRRVSSSLFLFLCFRGIFGISFQLRSNYTSDTCFRRNQIENRNRKSDRTNRKYDTVDFQNILRSTLSRVRTRRWPSWMSSLSFAGFPEAMQYNQVYWAKYLVTIGAMCGMTTVSVVTLYTIVRAAYSMAEDGLLFPLFAVISKRTQVHPYV